MIVLDHISVWTERIDVGMALLDQGNQLGAELAATSAVVQNAVVKVEWPVKVGWA